jgi:parallel beta-helix repeat protein
VLRDAKIEIPLEIPKNSCFIEKRKRTMCQSRFRPSPVVFCAVLFAALSQTATANTLCVDPRSQLCYAKIQSAVNAASNNDVIDVARGTYNEDVVIGKPLSLIGAGADTTVIDATGLSNGIFVDGFDNPGLNNVTVAGFTVKNALWEGVLIVSASDVTIRNNTLVNNDKAGPVFTGATTGCPGQPAFETDETGDCGGALHLIGTVRSIVSDNLMSGNADGILISDETAESRDNVLIHNIVTNNPLDCGIVLASHAPAGHTSPPFAPHWGIDNNTVAENLSASNGVQVGGAGVGLFSDGNGQGRVSGNVIIRNELTGNGLPGVALHTHVGPAFGLPADDMSGNMIIGNFISGNGADSGDTATPGPTGININSGSGGSPVYGTIISQNVIRNEQVDVAVNTPAELDMHLNELLGGNVGAANVCALDSVPCVGSIDATNNFWGCPAGPGGKGCTTISGPSILFTPWLQNPIGNSPVQLQ